MTETPKTPETIEQKQERAKETVRDIQIGYRITIGGADPFIVEEIKTDSVTRPSGKIESTLDIKYTKNNAGRTQETWVGFDELWSKLLNGNIKIEKPVKKKDLSDEEKSTIDGILGKMLGTPTGSPASDEEPVGTPDDDEEDIDDLGNTVNTKDEDLDEDLESAEYLLEQERLENTETLLNDLLSHAKRVKEAGRDDLYQEALVMIKGIQVLYDTYADLCNIPTEDRVHAVIYIEEGADEKLAEPVTVSKNDSLKTENEKQPAPKASPNPAPKPPEPTGTEATADNEAETTFETLSDSVLRDAVKKTLSGLAPKLVTNKFEPGTSPNEYTMTLEINRDREQPLLITTTYRTTPENTIAWVNEPGKTNVRSKTGETSPGLDTYGETTGELFEKHFLNELEKASGKKITGLKVGTGSDVLQVSFEK